jgi:outer membrane protein assembly factor BamD
MRIRWRLRAVLPLFFLSILLFLPGCGGKEAEKKILENFNDSQLYQFGMAKFKEKKYAEARAYFTRLENYFPESSYLKEVRLLIADTHFYEGGVGGYIEALAEYKSYLDLYPASQKADYAQFQLAMCYYKQMLEPTRDTTNARKAYAEFRKFLDTHENSSLYPEAKKRFQEVSDCLARHELAVGKFYYQRRNYRAAVRRLKEALKRYPDSLLGGEIYYYLGKTLYDVNNLEEAEVYFKKLLTDFPKFEKIYEIKNYLAELKSEISKKKKKELSP